MRGAPRHFAEVISCDRCVGYPKLLRDDYVNLPQPGYVGSNYTTTRVLLVGQNPANTTGHDRDNIDTEYAEAFTTILNNPTVGSMKTLQTIQERRMPTWKVVTEYFPIAQCGLKLEDIAYTNVVRCRTVENATPGIQITRTCISNHLVRWLDWLQPSVVVCIGKWAHDNIVELLEERRIPNGFMNRRRSLSRAERQENWAHIVNLVRSVMHDKKLRTSQGIKVPTKAQATSIRAISRDRASTEPPTQGTSAMTKEEYVDIFLGVGILNWEKPNTGRKARHRRKSLPTLYWNHSRSGGSYFTTYKDHEGHFSHQYWNHIPARKNTDDVPRVITIVPRAGIERKAFEDFLS